MKPEIILVGGGGHCMAVIDVIEQENKYAIKGILDDRLLNKKILGYPILGGDDKIQSLIEKNVFFLVTVGQIKNFKIRSLIVKKLELNNANIARVISPLAYVSPHAKLDRGTIVMHYAVVNANAEIGQHCIINTKANIEHGVESGDFCHISTGAIVNGDSIVNRGSFIGSNATISNGIVIEENSVIGAGKFIKK